MAFSNLSSRRAAAEDFLIDEKDLGHAYASRLVRHVQMQMDIDGEFDRAEESSHDPHPELYGIPVRSTCLTKVAKSDSHVCT